MIRRGLTLLLVGSLGAIAWAQSPSEMKPVTDRLAASVYTGPSMATLRELTDTFGGRLTGSPAYQRSADWAAAKFRGYGIQNVKLEPFTIPAGWQRVSATGTMLSPLSRPLSFASLGWSPSTPAGGVKGSVVLISDVSAEKLKETDQLRGAHDMLWGARLLPLPGAEIGMEDGKLIMRLLERGPVVISLAIANETSGETKVNNVIAEIRGSERPDEWILIGAHLDSWDFGTGAQDNGAGTVSVLEVARVLMTLGKAPRRSVRFALWGGEEQGLLGSYAYVQVHKNELNKCVAVLNTDNGAGHPKGWKVEGRKDLKDAIQPWSDSLLKDLNGGDLSLEATYDTDHGPFMLHGIPALDLWVDESKYFEIHHKASDTIDKVDTLDFKAGEAIVAVTAYALAQSDNPIAPHIDHAAVGEILKGARLDELLEHVGVWKP